jgi:hypothetical protein
MKYILSLLFIFCFFLAYSQDNQSSNSVTISKFIKVKATGIFTNNDFDYGVILSNGDTLYKGSKIKLGRGTLPNGDFNYIATPSNTMEAKLKRTTTLTEMKLKEINIKGNEKYGYKYYFKTDGGFLIQLENAAATGEIVFGNSITKN